MTDGDLRNTRCDVCGQLAGVVPPYTADLGGQPWNLCNACAEQMEVELRKKRARNQAENPELFMRQTTLFEKGER